MTVSGSTNPNDFEVTWEKSQTFCDALTVTYDSNTKQFRIKTKVLDGQLKSTLQDEWIVVKHKSTGLTRYIHVFVIDQFKFKTNPTLTRVGTTNNYLLRFQIPPTEVPEGSTEPIYPVGLYPIDVNFATSTLKAYGLTQNGSVSL